MSVDPGDPLVRDLPAHLPRPVQAARGHAGRICSSTSATRRISSSSRRSSTAPTTWTLPRSSIIARISGSSRARPPASRASATATSAMAPYYMIMRLPGEPRAEFVLMLPMVPSQRENMIAWLAARCDPPDYGKLVVYEFPKDKLVYRAVPDRGAHQAEHRDLAADLAVEPDGLARHPRQSPGGADRELDPLRLAAVSARRDAASCRSSSG